jgi:hypothetical protein
MYVASLNGSKMQVRVLANSTLDLLEVYIRQYEDFDDKVRTIRLHDGGILFL